MGFCDVATRGLDTLPWSRSELELVREESLSPSPANVSGVGAIRGESIAAMTTLYCVSSGRLLQRERSDVLSARFARSRGLQRAKPAAAVLARRSVHQPELFRNSAV